ncbi:hypothetical protein C8R43DRAFT_1023009 [Mycena crocata]|nr:hypothetical protein C8R43DRAFT_1023009 [Mycena crocata]
MNLFSPRPKRSRRSSRVPFNPWNYHTSQSYTWPSSIYSPLHPPSALPWTSSGLSPTLLPSWGASTFHSYGWENSWYTQSPYNTSPQTPWPSSMSMVQPWSLYPNYTQHQSMSNWDIATPPATSFSAHDSRGMAVFTDLTVAVSESVEKIRIYVEKPVISYWTKQWGYATAYKRSGKAITLLDVLEAIYNYFQEPLSVDVLPPRYQGMLTAAYSKRIAKSSALCGSGLARVDVLNGCRVLSAMRHLSFGDAAGTIYIAVELRRA